MKNTIYYLIRVVWIVSRKKSISLICNFFLEDNFILLKQNLHANVKRTQSASAQLESALGSLGVLLVPLVHPLLVSPIQESLNNLRPIRDESRLSSTQGDLMLFKDGSRKALWHE